ncbi:MAG: helix-turn-helix domain-containing protein, partial [Anaerolineae bacterium]
MSPQEHMSLKEICNAARETIKPFTTGEVARYCGVSRMGVIRWIQQGKLKAYVTPGGHYRIQATDFYAFLERFNMPLYNLAHHVEVKRILVVADDTPTLGTIMKVLGQLSTECEIKVALDILAAKSKLTTFQPT